MRPKRNPVPRARDAWVWLGGLLLLGVVGALITGAAIVLWENVDIRQLVPELAASPPESPVPEAHPPAARDAQDFEAVLFSSPRNQAYFPDVGYYRTALDSWAQTIEEAGGSVREVVDAAGLRSLDELDLLVLVEAPCLSDDEMDAVRGHLEAGGGVLTNWAVGARDADCEWVGWESIVELTGAEDVRELPSRPGLYLTVPGEVPLSPGFGPGTRIELRPDPSLALRLPGPRVYWSDWALNPQPDETGGGADVAVVTTRSPFGGRITWFGLRLGQGATPQDDGLLTRLIHNGIAWAAGIPLAAAATWPDAARAALTFTLDVESEPRNALHTAEALLERNLRGTFYVVSQLVLEDPELAQALIAAGEVGSQTSDHTPLAGLTAADQRARLRRAWAEVEGWAGVAPAGLRPPEETFDTNTLVAWQRAGGTYLLGSNEARSAGPEIHRAGAEPIVLLPRILKDDYNIIVQDRVLRAVTLREAFLAGANKVRAIGGLAVIAGHTQIMREGSRIDALTAVADTALAQGDWWITNGADIAEWWAARAETSVAFDPGAGDGASAESGVSDIVVAAPLNRTVGGLWVDVVLPEGREGLVPLVDGRPVDHQSTDWGMRVPVGYMQDGESRRITFLVLEDDAGDADDAR